MIAKAQRLALTGGDDYEILATVAAAKADKFAREASEVGVRVSRIGEIVEHRHGMVVLGHDGMPIELDRMGHTHF